MTWFKVDDGFWSHPKTATLSDSAVALWVRAGAYSCQHLTDGLVQHRVLRMVGTSEAADELVEVGLWHEVAGGWVFHDWEDYQETRAVVEARRAAARERQRRGREARAAKRAESDPRSKSQVQSRSEAQTESRGMSRRDISVTDGVSHGVSSLVPTRPDPTRPVREERDCSSAPRLNDRPTSSASSSSSAYPAEFEEFWSAYPRKQGKRKALAAWRRALKRASNQELIEGALRYRHDPNREDEFTKHGESWLNADAWLDDPLPARGRGRKSVPELTGRQRRFLEAELLKERPDPRAVELAKEHGLGTGRDGAAPAGGAGLRQPDGGRGDGLRLVEGGADRQMVL